MRPPASALRSLKSCARPPHLGDRGFVFPTNGFAIIASRQAPAVAGRSATILAETLKSGARGSEAAGIAEALAIVASRMEPAEAQRICGAAARAIADTVKRNRDNADEATALAALGRSDGAGRGAAHLRRGGPRPCRRFARGCSKAGFRLLTRSGSRSAGHADGTGGGAGLLR